METGAFDPWQRSQCWAKFAMTDRSNVKDLSNWPFSIDPYVMSVVEWLCFHQSGKSRRLELFLALSCF